MRHFAHHIGDYAAATAHLSFVEDAAYHRLLRLYYRDERALPADVAACQRLVAARSKEERAAVDAMLHEFFTLEDDGWHQSRADDELAAYQLRSDAARENGRLGGRPKTKRKPNDKPTGNQDGLQNEPNEKLTNNHEPITSNQGEAPLAPRSADDAGKPNRATRLPDGWQASPTLDDFAREQGLEPSTVWPKFIDHWRAAAGPNARKLDWDAAARNWCRREAGQRSTRPQDVRAARNVSEAGAFYRAGVRLGGG